MGNSPASLRRRFRGNKSPESSSKLTKGKKRRSGLAGSFKDTTVPMESPPRATDGRFRLEASASEGVNEQAVAVAAATAAVAEAALAAAHAAAAVVRLTGGNPGTPAHVSLGGRRAEELAAVKIQSAFRAYLARRALRALKGLVKLQALVRGHFVRRQTADILRRMNALARVQARARANRAHHPLSDSPLSTSNSFARHVSIAFPTPDRSMHKLGSPILKRCASNSKTRNATPQTKPHLVPNWPDQWIETHNSWNNPANDEKSDKILEVDTGVMPVHFTRSTRTFQAPTPSVHSREEPALYWDNVLKSSAENDDDGSTPQVFSASSRFSGGMRRGALTPGRSERLRGFSNGYMDHPNYMANTESSRAKVRAQSAPRQRRIEFEHPQGSISRRDVHGLWDAGAYSSRGWDSRSIDYTISGRFDRFDDRLLSPSLR